MLLGCTLCLTALAQQPVRFDPFPDPPAGLVFEQSGDKVRMRLNPPFLPKALGFIDTLSPHCYQPDPASNVCFVNFMSHSVTSDQYVTRLDVLVDGRLVIRVAGFIQYSFSIPRAQLGDQGIKLACGTAGISGDPDPLVGFRYAWSVHARDSAGTTAANYGNISCPVFYPEQVFSDGFEATPP